ncbi:PAS domain-containing protein [Acinetobacter baumannii]
MTDCVDHVMHQQEVLDVLTMAVRAIGCVLPGNAELVLHDLRNPEFSIVEVANAHVTGRRKGDPVLAGMRQDKAFASALEKSDQKVTLLTDYETFSRDGTSLRSSTAIFRDSNSEPFAALCINVNNNGINEALSILQTLAGLNLNKENLSPVSQENTNPEDSIENLMGEIIQQATDLNSGNKRSDAKKANLLAVQKMQERGIFLMKGGVEKAAEALGVTRYTIYNYLDELKNDD